MNKSTIKLLCLLVPVSSWRKKIRNKYIKRTFNNHSYAGGGFKCAHKDTIIGKFCSIGENVAIGPSQHPLNWLSTHPFQYNLSFNVVTDKNLKSFSFKPVVIGNDVWIGNNAIIMDGIKVGDGSIIGANSVVTKDVPPYAIVGGVPAKIIKYRFSEDIIKELLELKWWNLDDKEIAKLPFDNIEKCIKQLKSLSEIYPTIGDFFTNCEDLYENDLS